MTRTGTLTIDATDISRLDGTRLMKGAVNNGGFGRATIFLRQDRHLNSGETIWVDGVDDEFQGMSVIVIKDAGRAAQDLIASAAATETAAAGKQGRKAATKKAVKRTDGSRKGGKKSAAKKSASKKSGGKKKSGSGRGSAKRSPGKSNK